MSFLDWILGLQSKQPITTKKGYTYYPVDDDDIPRWVWKKFHRMEKKGATQGSFKVKKYRYIVIYAGGGFYDCWKRERGQKNKIR